MAKGNALRIPHRTLTHTGVKIIYDCTTGLVTLSPPTFPFGELSNVGRAILGFGGRATEPGLTHQTTHQTAAPTPARRPMSEETKQKLRQAMRAREAAKTPPAQPISAGTTKTRRRTPAKPKSMTAGAEG